MPKFPYTLSDENKPEDEALGSVQDEETLIRAWHHPECFDDNGDLKPSAISRDDLMQNGLSLDREPLFNEETLITTVKTQQGRVSEGRTKVYLSKTLCADIRQLKNNDKRIVIVKDKPIPENPAHSGIYSLEKSPAEVRKDRSELADLFKESFEEWDISNI